MPQINELPTEVLEKMAQKQGIDTTQVEPPSQELLQPSTGALPQPDHTLLRDTIARMKKENGPIRRFNRLLAQRETFNGNIKRLQDQQTADMLKEKAKANRDMLAKMFLGGV